MSAASIGPGYTGHVNDPDTALIYMQARYYDPAIGRFLSRDAVSSKIGDINYVNKYDYVGDNPIVRTDPTGNYICSGTKGECSAISGALADIQKAAEKMAAGIKGQQALTNVVKFYGKEGVANGVSVAFGGAHGNNAETQTVGKETSITFNLKNIRLTGSFSGTSMKVELAAATAHEGQHGIDGQFFGPTYNKEQWRAAEKNAFMTQSYVNQAFNATSPYNLWEKGWSDNSITNSLRESAAGFNADSVVYGAGGDNQGK
jgi:RHS repeat-associated protein